MISFEAIVKIGDTYGHDNISDEEIKKILIKTLEMDSDVEVLEVIEIKRTPNKASNLNKAECSRK